MVYILTPPPDATELYEFGRKDEDKTGKNQPNTSYIYIDEISVSRVHAIISLKDKKFQLRDYEKDSKYGTLVKIQSDHYMPNSESIQIGRTVLHGQGKERSKLQAEEKKEKMAREEEKMAEAPAKGTEEGKMAQEDIKMQI